MKRSYGTVVLILAAVEFGVGQKAGFSAQPGFQYGKVATLALDRKKIQQYGFTLDLNRKTNGESYWQADHKYPQMGLQMAGRFFPESNVLKSAFTLIPYLEFNVWKTNFGTLEIKHGTGLAYFSDDLKIPDQSPLGSKLNAATMLDAGYQFRSKSAIELKIGVLASHISNGNLVRPNAGLNSWLTYVNLVYFPKNKLNTRPTFEKHIPTKRWHFRVGAAAGFYDYKKAENQIERNLQLSLLAFYQHSTRFRTGAGLEIGRLISKNKIQPAAYLEEEVLFGHLVTRYGLGAYLTRLLPGEDRTYEKVGIAWYPGQLKNQIPQGFSIGANIKAHGFRAAHVEVAASFNFE